MPGPFENLIYDPKNEVEKPPAGENPCGGVFMVGPSVESEKGFKMKAPQGHFNEYMLATYAAGLKSLDARLGLTTAVNEKAPNSEVGIPLDPSWFAEQTS